MSISLDEPLPGPIGRYRPVKLLGRGGMAEVFLADFTGPGGFSRRVALKMVLPALSSNAEMTTMFLDEARVAAHFTHPNLVPVFDFGEVDGRYFMAMEYARGMSLRALQRELLQKKARLPDAILAAIGAHVSAGLAYAHALSDAEGRPLRIVHRDLSPENIFLTVEGVAKILDFGIVRAEGRSSQTRAGTIKGKPAYMSPEQIRCEELDGRSDVFALGIVLWECLTMTRRYGSATGSAILKAAVTETAPDVGARVPDCGSALAAVVMSTLERDRERRPTSADLQGAFDALVYQSDHPNPQVSIAAFLKGTLSATPMVTGVASTASVATSEGPQPTPSVESLPHWPLSASPHDAEATDLVSPEWAEPPAPSPAADASTALLAAREAPPPEPSEPELPPAIVPAPGMAFSRARGSANDAAADAPLELAERARPAPDLMPAAAPAPFVASARKPPPSSSSSPVTWLAAACAVVLLGGIALIARHGSQPPPAPAPSLTPASVTIPLVIASDPPGAAIEIDGNDTGRVTPAPIPVAVFDDHTWALTLKGYLRSTGKVTKDQLSTPLRVTLVVPAELDVTTTPPGAEVACDGVVVVGASPGTATIGRGDHVLRATKDGFLPVEEHVSVTADKLSWEPTLSPAAYLDITSEPGDAKISIDGVASAMLTPATKLPVKAGVRHELLVAVDGLEAKHRLGKLAAGSVTRLTLHLVDPTKAASDAKLAKLEKREAALEAEKDRLEAQNSEFVIRGSQETAALMKRERRIKAIEDELEQLQQEESDASE